MISSQIIGSKGEKYVIKLIRCPNCNKELMELPKNYPLYDIQCKGCTFRAQVKTVNAKPKNNIFGAGWDIFEKVLKSGFLSPPLIVNFRWPKNAPTDQTILFYPFIPKENIKKYRLSSTAKQANYRMFSYVGLLTLPHFIWDPNSAWVPHRFAVGSIEI
jgi:transcription elongation factor Elf1